MIEILKKTISQVIEEEIPLDDWKKVKKAYFWYSFISFFSIAMCVSDIEKKDAEANELLESGCKKGLIEKSVAEYIRTLHHYEKVICIMVENYSIHTNLSMLYQEYIALEFYVQNGRFTFGNGKFNRDILGAYYTSEEFAYEITRKAIDDYLYEHVNILNYSKSGKCYGAVKDEIAKMTFLDSSCGSGEFLIAVIKYCKTFLKYDDELSKNLVTNLYGFDVDPLALLITRARIMMETNRSIKYENIILGNPLIQNIKETNIMKKYSIAAQGRFYNETLGIKMPAIKFSILLGNPPWEKIRFEEKKFLFHYIQNIESINAKNDREEIITNQITKKNSEYYYEIKNDYAQFKKNIKKNSILKHSLHGELNTYILFTELSSCLITEDGIVAIIVKSSLLKTPVCSPLFTYLVENRIIYEAFMFTNRKQIFAIDAREEFSVILLNGTHKKRLKIAMNLENYTNLNCAEKFEITTDFLKLVNPITKMMPNVTSLIEMKFLTKIYNQHAYFENVYRDCRFGRLVHLTNHSAYIAKQHKHGYLPIYEGKFIEQYTGKYSSFGNMKEKDKYKSKATARNIKNPEGKEYPEARYFIEKNFWSDLSKNFNNNYTIMWRSLTSATNRRTMLATLLPNIPTCQSLQLLQIDDKESMLQILALFNSIIFDYIVRLKMVGLDLTQTIIRQIPVPDQVKYYEVTDFKGRNETLGTHIYSRIYKLYKNDERINEFFDGVSIYPIAEQSNRKKIIKDIDLLIAMAYEISKEELKEIALLFDKYYTKEEVRMWF